MRNIGAVCLSFIFLRSFLGFSTPCPIIAQFPGNLTLENAHKFNLRLATGREIGAAFNGGNPFPWIDFFYNKNVTESALEEYNVAKALSKEGEVLLAIGDHSAIQLFKGLKAGDTPSAADVISLKIKNGRYVTNIRELKSTVSDFKYAIKKAMSQIISTIDHLDLSIHSIGYLEIGLRSEAKEDLIAPGMGYRAEGVENQKNIYYLWHSGRQVFLKAKQLKIPVYVRFWNELNRVTKPSPELVQTQPF